jgi:hypothetical protein
MTDKRTDQWWDFHESTNYKQPKVNQPPLNQNPNNAVFAVDHFSHKYELWDWFSPPRYGVVDDGGDGRGRRGDVTIRPFWCNVQPERPRDEAVLEKLREGDKVKGFLVVTYNPFIPNQADPDYAGDEPTAPMYPDGIYVRTSDQRHKVGGDGFDMEIDHAFSSVLKYDGLLWKAVKNDLMHGGGDEDVFDKRQVIGRAIFSLWEDFQHERHASISNDELFIPPP